MKISLLEETRIRYDPAFAWPSLPAARLGAAHRVAAQCPVHVTLERPPAMTITGTAAPAVASPATASSATYPVVRFTVHGVPRDPAAGAEGDGFYSTAGYSGVGEGRPYTVVYDGHCKVCGRLVGVLRLWDRHSRRLEIVPSQMPGLAERFPWIPPSRYLESLQVIGPGGTTWERAAAVERLIDVLPRGAVLSWVFDVPGVRAATDRFYRWFARNRYRLGCGEHCSYHPA